MSIYSFSTPISVHQPLTRLLVDAIDAALNQKEVDWRPVVEAVKICDQVQLLAVVCPKGSSLGQLDAMIALSKKNLAPGVLHELLTRVCDLDVANHLSWSATVTILRNAHDLPLLQHFLEHERCHNLLEHAIEQPSATSYDLYRPLAAAICMQKTGTAKLIELALDKFPVAACSASTRAELRNVVNHGISLLDAYCKRVQADKEVRIASHLTALKVAVYKEFALIDHSIDPVHGPHFDNARLQNILVKFDDLNLCMTSHAAAVSLALAYITNVRKLAVLLIHYEQLFSTQIGKAAFEQLIDNAHSPRQDVSQAAWSALHSLATGPYLMPETKRTCLVDVLVAELDRMNIAEIAEPGMPGFGVVRPPLEFYENPFRKDRGQPPIICNRKKLYDSFRCNTDLVLPRVFELAIDNPWRAIVTAACAHAKADAVKDLEGHRDALCRALVRSRIDSLFAVINLSVESRTGFSQRGVSRLFSTLRDVAEVVVRRPEFEDAIFACQKTMSPHIYAIWCDAALPLLYDCKDDQQLTRLLRVFEDIAVVEYRFGDEGEFRSFKLNVGWSTLERLAEHLGTLATTKTSEISARACDLLGKLIDLTNESSKHQALVQPAAKFRQVLTDKLINIISRSNGADVKRRGQKLLFSARKLELSLPIVGEASESS